MPSRSLSILESEKTKEILRTPGTIPTPRQWVRPLTEAVQVVVILQNSNNLLRSDIESLLTPWAMHFKTVF